MRQIWFGIPGEHMQWCPAPLAGAQATNINHVESIAFENGGADVSRSKQYRKQYSFDFAGPSKDLDGVGIYNKFASGFYGDGLFYFADPYAFETNLFPAAWASPGLIEQGWRSIYGIEPTFTNTVSNIYNQPPRSATFTIDITQSPRRVYLAIPPTHTLNIGASGSVLTGTPVIRIRPVNTDGTLATAVNLTLLDPAAATRMNATFAGSSYQAVYVELARTSSVASTMSLTSMIAQLVETGSSLTLTGNHLPGEGHTGLEFSNDARVENYIYMYPPRKGMSTTLVEVGAWR